MAKKPCLCSLNRRIEVVRRALVPPEPGKAEPRYQYTRVFGVRAELKTMGGTTPWNTVEIGGEKVTHSITIRHTRIAFDTRDRVRDGAGNLYKIAQIENVDEQNEWMRLQCIKTGPQETEAAR